MNRFDTAIELAKLGYDVTKWVFDVDNNEYPITKKSNKSSIPPIEKLVHEVGKELMEDSKLEIGDTIFSVREFGIKEVIEATLNVLYYNKKIKDKSGKQIGKTSKKIKKSEKKFGKPFPIIHCKNPSGKCSCETFDEINCCEYQC